MKPIFFFAFFILTAFTSGEKLNALQLIKRKWELVKITNFNYKSVYQESGNTYFTFRDKDFSILSNVNKTPEMNNGTWDYIEDSQTLNCQIENQQLLYKLIKLTEQSFIIQHIDFKSGDRIQEEFKSVK